MKITHVQPNKNRNIRTLPVTGNYLVKESSGMLRWAEPNESWRFYATTGGQQAFITNIRYDDSEHSSDLWIYSPLKKDEMGAIRAPNHKVIGKQPCPNIQEELIDENRIYLNRGRNWYIRQFVESSSKIGVKRFTGLPLNAFWAMWRRTIPANDIQIFGLSNNQMKVIYAGLKFGVFLKWPELQSDMGTSDTLMTQNRVQWKVSKRVMPWIHKNCQGGFMPFSDYDTIFPDDQDEITYTIDIA